MKKKISLVLSIILAFTFFSFLNPTSARAENKDVVVGEKNLNSTNLGDQLLQPEKGWKRYDDSNININYIGNWKKFNHESLYNKSSNESDTSKTNKVKFKFSGNKFRIISWNSNTDSNISSEAKINIDNEKSGKINFKVGTVIQGSVLVYQNLELDNKEHIVEIINESNKYISIDAIDIDENGELKPYVDSITLDKTSISVIAGKTESLTAMVKPDDATNKEIEWSSSDKDIAEYKDGKVVAGKKIGHATITAKVKGIDLKATCEVNVTEDRNKAILAITMVNGITKEYDVSADEAAAFEKWFDSSNGKGQLRYGFNKKINPYKQVKEYVVFDKIASFEIRSYEADK
ncbi:Uncharacterized conserved protein YjdB, contains Ig-like domain [Clostridium cavendishii DSM 21758]|uniref:Uncharacterized conserved protein YjdB, contains Ig-like domain n=1 Tax=Clostridium cavendishii DSM 21758 TaxID=1121302 RepID=A0A1M6CRJ9_9CLOT|nr:Ig-like domain-containing protein [Clostridium cavendishii]SHI63642.1 Uncharacterized conserved protein YjdB, contains Ig-like domain [Clostridium cavendishii DSM 21758]